MLYAKHLRLMVLGLLLGLTCGLVYYTYSRSVYQSRALIRLDTVRAPYGGGYSIQALAEQLGMRHVTELAARRLGLVNEYRGSYEWIRDALVKRVDVKIVSPNTVSIEVFPFRADLLESFPRAMLAAVQEELNAEAARGYHLQLQRWKEEMDLLRSQMEEVGREQSAFSNQNAATELFIQQQGLAQVPTEMIRVRSRIDEFEQVQNRMERGDLDTVSKLALINDFLDSGALRVGSRLGTGETSPATVPTTTDAKGRQVPDPMADAIPAMVRPAETGPDIVVVPSMVESLQPWQKLDRQRRMLLEQIEAAARTMLPGHRTMIDLNKRLATVEQGLNAELEIALKKFDLEFAALRERLTKLQGQMPDYEEVMGKFASFRHEFMLRSGSQLNWAEAYFEVAKNLAKANFSAKPREAVPTPEFVGFTVFRSDPVSPPKGKLTAMAILIGLGLALMLPMLVERLNDSVSRIEDLETALNLPGLGIIPVYDPKELENLARSPEIDATRPDWLMENFRNIRSGIALNRDLNATSQVVMVSSARPREGKTTVALNLAWAFASMGERTLLLDCDLRRGRVHRSLGLDNPSGITDVIMRGTSWREALHKTANPNLDVLSRGPIIPGSTEALCRDGFAALMQEFRGEYARVVLDTPPVLGLSEPASLQRVVDGVVLVVLAERTSQKDVVQALSILRKSGGRFFGFVLNRLDLRDLHNYYNYSHYSPYYYSAIDQGDADPEPAPGRA